MKFIKFTARNTFFWSQLFAFNNNNYFGEVGGEVAQTMYTHMNKCKNNKIKKNKEILF
jgi:hypothetical protein